MKLFGFNNALSQGLITGIIRMMWYYYYTNRFKNK